MGVKPPSKWASLNVSRPAVFSIRAPVTPLYPIQNTPVTFSSETKNITSGSTSDYGYIMIHAQFSTNYTPAMFFIRTAVIIHVFILFTPPKTNPLGVVLKLSFTIYYSFISLSVLNFDCGKTQTFTFS